jgi:hypothetical protein
MQESKLNQEEEVGGAVEMYINDFIEFVKNAQNEHGVDTISLSVEDGEIIIEFLDSSKFIDDEE